jgi:hypothetical protein
MVLSFILKVSLCKASLLDEGPWHLTYREMDFVYDHTSHPSSNRTWPYIGMLPIHDTTWHAMTARHRHDVAIDNPLTTTFFDWCYDGGRPPLGISPTQIFVTCHPLWREERWRKFWIYKTSLIQFLWWHSFQYTTHGNRTLLQERWKCNIFAPILTMGSFCCSTGHTR